MYRQKFEVKFVIHSNNPFEVKEEQLKQYIEFRLGILHMSNVDFRLSDIDIKTQTHEG